MLPLASVSADFSAPYLDRPYLPYRRHSFWYGGLQDRFGLVGVPTLPQIQRVLARDIGGTWARQRGNATPALHMTFAAPQGIGLAALVAGEERLLAAHEDAVQSTLDFMRRRLGYRARVGGKTSHVPAAEVLFAIFHRCSLESASPYLHTQVLLFNLCRRSDEAWTALGTGFITRGRAVLELVYRTELARYLDACSIPARWDTEAFDIVSIDENIRARFAGRKWTPESTTSESNRSVAPLEKERGRTPAGKAKRVPTGYAFLRQQWLQAWPEAESFAVGEVETGNMVAEPTAQDIVVGVLNALGPEAQGMKHQQLLRHALVANRGMVAAEAVDRQIAEHLARDLRVRGNEKCSDVLAE